MALLALPVAPVRGVIWVAEKLNGATERELHDPGVLRAQPAVLNGELEDGDTSLEELKREDERLLARLDAAAVGPRAERSKVTHSWMTQPR
ncbi:gas vesicle protein GvpG [Streptomyces sp. NPDC014724]|uniref:gas vesicle protein GvpG n=1 Tax=unclassified Streptomyces TaxID=2593676 RepID=UPI0036FC2E6B